MTCDWILRVLLIDEGQAVKVYWTKTLKLAETQPFGGCDWTHCKAVVGIGG